MAYDNENVGLMIRMLTSFGMPTRTAHDQRTSGFTVKPIECPPYKEAVQIVFYLAARSQEWLKWSETPLLTGVWLDMLQLQLRNLGVDCKIGPTRSERFLALYVDMESATLAGLVYADEFSDESAPFGLVNIDDVINPDKLQVAAPHQSRVIPLDRLALMAIDRVGRWQGNARQMHALREADAAFLRADQPVVEQPPAIEQHLIERPNGMLTDAIVLRPVRPQLWPSLCKTFFNSVGLHVNFPKGRKDTSVVKLWYGAFRSASRIENIPVAVLEIMRQEYMRQFGVELNFQMESEAMLLVRATLNPQLCRPA